MDGLVVLRGPTKVRKDPATGFKSFVNAQQKCRYVLVPDTETTKTPGANNFVHRMLLKKLHTRVHTTLINFKI